MSRREYMIRWRRENVERLRESRNRWNRKNKDKVRIYRQRLLAKQSEESRMASREYQRAYRSDHQVDLKSKSHERYIKNRSHAIEKAIEYRKRMSPEAKARRNARNIQWQKENPEKVLAIRARACSKNREAIRRRSRERYRNNQEEIIAKIRKWRADNPEKVALAKKKWKERNRSKVLAHAKRTRLKYRDRILEYLRHYFRFKRAGLVEFFLGRDGDLCYLCGESLSDSGSLNVDHYIPKSKGGSSDLENLRLTHEWCNKKKSDRMPWDLNLISFRKAVA